MPAETLAASRSAATSAHSEGLPHGVLFLDDLAEATWLLAWSRAHRRMPVTLVPGASTDGIGADAAHARLRWTTQVRSRGGHFPVLASRPRKRVRLLAHTPTPHGFSPWETRGGVPTLLVFHEVDDVDHWLSSPKREEVFGPLGITVRTFRDPEGSNRVGLITEVPDMAAFEEVMQSEAATDAMKFDGVHPETLLILT